MKKYFLFVGTRPNFMKAAPLCRAFNKAEIDYEIYHSGQHYDTNLSSVFHKQFNLDIKNMRCENFSNPIRNMQNIFKRAREILRDNKASVKAVIVFGDVITTLAIALAAKKLKIKLIHVEAGLRSFDISMPEELIRIATDHFSNILFSPSDDAVNNLKKEGKDRNVFMVGNIMIDCLENFMGEINNKEIEGIDLSSEYVVATFHRPENVDDRDRAYDIFNELAVLSKQLNVFFPMHPRTRENFIRLGIFERLKSHGIIIIEPMCYFSFMKLILKSKAVITDSGGIQEETTYLNIPCFTVRKTTERPVTIQYGTNTLISPKEISNRIFNFHQRQGNFANPPLWDGKTSERIIEILERK